MFVHASFFFKNCHNGKQHSAPPSVKRGWRHQYLGIWHVFASVAQFLGQLVHDVFEYDGVNVLSEQVEQEPVPDDGLLHDEVDVLGLDAPVPDP